MGVPSTTALVLVGFGLSQGLDEAMRASEGCLAGLVASAAMPLVYARAASAGWRWPGASAAALAGYAVVGSVVWWLPVAGAAGCATGAAVGLALACHLAGRLRAYAGDSDHEPPGARGAGGGSFVWRTAVPLAFFSALQGLRSLAGAGFSGRFITFPGGSLAVLVTTHIEAGPATACRLAAGMPFGGLGMLAFLVTFRFGCPRFGLGWGTAIGYAAALATLAAAGYAAEFSRPCALAPTGLATAERRRWRASASGSVFTVGAFARRLAPPLERAFPFDGDSARVRRGVVVRRRFSPGLEALAG